VARDDTTSATLRDTEQQRAADLRRRKFGEDLPVEAADRARQMRFLAGRGFSADTIRRVLRAEDD
jgi:regulatory protein